MTSAFATFQIKQVLASGTSAFIVDFEQVFIHWVAMQKESIRH